MQRNEPIDAETLLSTPLPLAVADSRPAARRAFLVGRCQQGRQKLAVPVALPPAGPGRRDLGPHHPAADRTVPLSGGHLRPHPGAFVPPDRGPRSQPVVLPDRKLRHRGRAGTPDREIPVPAPRNRAGGHRHLAEGPHRRPEQRRLRQRLSGYERAEIPGGPPWHRVAAGASSAQTGRIRPVPTDFRVQRPDGCRRHHLAAAAPADERHGPAAGDGP